MSDDEERPGGEPAKRHRLRNRILIGLAVLLVVVSSGLLIAYKQLEGNINAVSITEALGDDRPEAVEVEGPKKPMNVLVMGSDSRDGSNIKGATPGLSDTTILLHLSADRSRAYGVSLPRDAMVDRPTCRSKNGKRNVPGGLTQFNAAFAVGGPACTIKTVESLTNVRIDHYVVVNLAGFQQMVNAINGVTVCVPYAVDDPIGDIRLPAGTYKVNGKQALDYVRVRHGLGAPTGDIGRMKRQQVFIAAMVEKVVSKGTLANPYRLYRFLDAATESLTTDPAFARLKELATLGSELKDIGLDNIQFLTVPNEPYPPDTNRLQWSKSADTIWRKMRLDRPLGRLGADAVTPGGDKAGRPGKGQTGQAGKSPSSSPSGSASPSAEPSPARPTGPSEEERKRQAEEAGLCT